MNTRKWRAAVFTAVAAAGISVWIALGGGATPLAAVGEVEFPLDAALNKPVADEALFTAQQILLRDCMADEGFEFYMAEYRAEAAWPRYGIADATAAAESGYAGLHSERMPYRGDLNEPFAGDPGWAAAFFGTDDHRYVVPAASATVIRPGNGCIWEADLVLYGDDPSAHYELIMAVNQVRGEAHDRFLEDTRVVGVFAEWSDCMASRGFAVGSPWEAFGIATENDPEGVAPAVADVACKQEVALVERLTEIESIQQMSLLADNQQLIDRWSKSIDTAVARATAVIEAETAP